MSNSACGKPPNTKQVADQEALFNNDTAEICEHTNIGPGRLEMDASRVGIFRGAALFRICL
jgi:hypothetical protein